MLVRILLPPIEVVAACIHAHVAATDPVWIDHRHALEHEVIPQFLRVLTVRIQQEFNEPDERPLSRYLPGVHSACQ